MSALFENTSPTSHAVLLCPASTEQSKLKDKQARVRYYSWGFQKKAAHPMITPLQSIIKANYAQRVGAGAPVYLPFLEYLAAEFLELASNAVRDTPSHVTCNSLSKTTPVGSQTQVLENFWEDTESGGKKFIVRLWNLEDGSADVYLTSLNVGFHIAPFNYILYGIPQVLSLHRQFKRTPLDPNCLGYERHMTTTQSGIVHFPRPSLAPHHALVDRLRATRRPNPFPRNPDSVNAEMTHNTTWGWQKDVHRIRQSHPEATHFVKIFRKTVFKFLAYIHAFMVDLVTGECELIISVYLINVMVWETAMIKAME
ncbi:hypothetical protein BU17DRAFT_71541 [Hysterangium stoloniferum]|nr:hypothetical protein BU17DRAFT_71541 [Hysterangium stoloniferum]